MNCIICKRPIVPGKRNARRGACHKCYRLALKNGWALLPSRRSGPRPRPALPLGDIAAALATGDLTLRRAAKTYGVAPLELKRLLYAPKRPRQPRDRAGAARLLAEVMRRG